MSSLTIILITPPLVLLSFPLFLFAILTTSLAFFALGIRVSIVYVELFVSVLQNVLSPSRILAPYIRKRTPIPASSQKRASSLNSHIHQTQPSSPTHVAKSLRRTSSTTTTSSLPSSKSGSTTPKALSFASNDPLSCSGIYMSGSAAISAAPLNRDFEGVGGWRMPMTSEEEDGDAEREEELWTGMNKRLQLPVPVPIVLQRSAASSRINLREDCDGVGHGKERRHKRSITGGATNVGKKMKDHVWRIAGDSSGERAAAKTTEKESKGDFDPHCKAPLVGKDRRKNKSMVTLGGVWTANMGRAMAAANHV